MTALLEPVNLDVIRTDWASIIRADLTQAIEGYISAGNHLAAAKADVAHGEWLPLLREIGIDRSDAYRLMMIAEKFTSLIERNGGNGGNYQHLPTAMRALWEISRLESEEIEAGIEDGLINPAMTINCAKEYNSRVRERRRAKATERPTITPPVEPEPLPEPKLSPEERQSRRLDEWSQQSDEYMKVTSGLRFANPQITMRQIEKVESVIAALTKLRDTCRLWLTGDV